MLTTNSFIKTLTGADETLFQLSGVPSSGIIVVLENLSDSESLTYSVEDSPDGSTWSVRDFPTSDCETTASIFVLGSESSHTLRIVKNGSHVRLVGSVAADTAIHTSISRTEETTGIVFL